MVAQLIQSFLDGFGGRITSWHLTAMMVVFALSIVARWLVYYTVARHDWFAREFEKRVNRHLEAEEIGHKVSFYVLSKRLLEKTFYEIFENREKLRRRKPDYVMNTSDRIFLIKAGCAWLVRDILKQARHLKWEGHAPKLLNITKNTFQKNPCFNKIFGYLPTANVNEILNGLPALFVIAGIFGTFLGVMSGLQELPSMNLADAEQTKAVMDKFLLHISHSMAASMTGIFCSVVLSLVNTIWNPDRVFVDMVDRFECALDLLWNRSDSNEVPKDEQEFDEHKDPMEALAEAALNHELEKRKRGRDLDGFAPKKAKSS